MKAKDKILKVLDTMSEQVVQDLIKEGATKIINESQQVGKNNIMFNANRLDMGRTAIVNRIRGGQVQMRKLVSQVQGFRIVDGSLVKMTPEEMRHRRIAAKISARKRAAIVSQIIRNRKVSLRKRDMRFGV